MKTIYLLVFFSIPNLFLSQIQNKKVETYSVKGTCEQCKTRIEEAVHQHHISNGTWNIESNILEIEYDSLQTNANILLQKVADVGHDNEKFMSKNETYNNLPDCCMYERNEDISKNQDSEKEVNDSKNENIKKDSIYHHEANSQNIDSTNLKVVQVKGKEELTKLTDLSSLTFSISKKELLKAACCNLSESFETNATVDVSYTNAVTGTKQLKMLGLDQKYTLLTKEFMPDIRGLGTALGLNFIPGRWIESIQLTKGTGTVVNGYESFSGQINAEMLKYKEPNEEITFNIFANNNSRVEFNATQTKEFSESFSNSMMFHVSGILKKIDENDDGFLDNPLSKQINFMNIFKFHSENGLESMFGINTLFDKKQAGQMDFQEDKDRNTDNFYGTNIETTRIQLWNKTGYVFKNKPYQSMGLQTQFVYHEHDSYFGKRTYNGTEKSFYANYIFESILGNTNHKYKVGASFLYDDYSEEYSQLNFVKTEKVQGFFAEYTYKYLEKFIVVAGSRIDFHSIAGTQFTPRINIKYNPIEKTTLRFSAGRSFRIANILIENIQYFASNRTIEIDFNPINSIIQLNPEIAWNYGISIAQEFKLFNRKSTIIGDFFRTEFQNQVVVDLENARKIQFYNLNGTSFANSFQIQWDFIPFQNLEARLAYKYYDVKSDFISGKNSVPFVPKNRAFLNLAYSTKPNDQKANWTFDYTLQYVGEQRLPDTSDNSITNKLPDITSNYFVINAQISRNFSRSFRLYVGAENLGNYKQKNAIIHAENPFNNEFDAPFIYAPIMGTNIYLGIDIQL